MQQHTETNIYFDADYFDASALDELNAIDLPEHDVDKDLLSSMGVTSQEASEQEIAGTAMTAEDEKQLVESVWEELMESELGEEFSELSKEEIAKFNEVINGSSNIIISNKQMISLDRWETILSEYIIFLILKNRKQMLISFLQDGQLEWSDFEYIKRNL